METNGIKNYQKGDTIECFVIAKTAEVRASSTGSKFLDITLMDATGEMNGKGWDWGDTPSPIVGSVIKIKGMVTEFSGKLQMRVDRLRPATPEETHWEALIPSAPEHPTDMWEELISLVDSFADADMALLAMHLLEQHKEKLLIWPAALSYHHAMRSGLLYHTLTVARAAEALLPIYPFLDRSLLLCGIMLHDLNKVDELEASSYGIASAYSREGTLLGHLVRGVEHIGEAGHLLQLPEEKIILLQHMVLSHHSEPTFGSPVRPMIPEAEVLHHLDNIDARMYEMRHALLSTKPGEFSERVRSLDNRKIYQRESLSTEAEDRS